MARLFDSIFTLHDASYEDGGGGGGGGGGSDGAQWLVWTHDP